MTRCPACADAGFVTADRTVEPCTESECDIGERVKQMMNHLGPWVPPTEPPTPIDPPWPPRP